MLNPKGLNFYISISSKKVFSSLLIQLKKIKGRKKVKSVFILNVKISLPVSMRKMYVKTPIEWF